MRSNKPMERVSLCENAHRAISIARSVSGCGGYVNVADVYTAKTERGKGWATRTVIELIRALKTQRLNYIQYIYEIHNIASVKVAKKSGFYPIFETVMCFKK